MAKPAHTCPLTKTALILSDTWTTLIMHALWSGPKRFCELERMLDGISTRTLTLKLKKLESDKMIKKNEEGAYETTPKGEGLKIVGNAMKKYGEAYL